jgi:shikimate dehydrogenase
MQYLGVIGEPGKKSLSPVFQQAALDVLNLELKYEAWPTPPNGLHTRITGLRAPTVLGANVTIPHKEAVLPLLDEVDGLVRRVGAVNTIINHEGRLFGHNTDVEGFLRALGDAGFDPAGAEVVIAGAGGAARAVVVGLADAGARSAAIINRTIGRAERLVSELSSDSAIALTALEATAENWANVAARAELLVNCTSLGTAGTSEENASPIPADVIRPEMLIYDLVYRPADTRLLRDARERGAITLGGLPMLIYQGAASLKIWTGRDAPVDVMRRAAEGALAAEVPS